MIEEALTRFPGVHRRNDSATYQFGLRVPKDLAQHYESPWAVRCSLQTADLREANAKARQLHAQWAETFTRQRAGRPAQAPPPWPMAPDLGQLRATLLDRLRRSLDGTDARVAAYSPEERRERVEDWQWCRADTVQGLQNGYVPDWQVEWLDKTSASLDVRRTPVVDSELLKHYVALTDIQIEALTDTTGNYPVRAELLAARHSLLQFAHDPGLRQHASAATQDTQTEPHRTIADALEQWKRGRSRLDKTVDTFTRHAGVFKEMLGDPPLSDWNKAMARRFRDALTEWARREQKTARTADNILLSIKTLSRIAQDEGWVQGTPFAGLSVVEGGRDSTGREPWTLAELATLFDDPIWTLGSLPPEGKAGGAAAYWMPLIACYTGARLSEIAQLWTDDIDPSAGAEVIEFRANKERQQKLKTKASWRAVPMHRELIRLGFARYVAALPPGPVFPRLPTAGKNGPGGVFGGWFGTYKAAKGFSSSAKTFHSFRHLVATELGVKNVNDALRDAILGHAGTGIGQKVYSATIRRTAEALRPTINLLELPLTNLRAIY